MNNFKSKGFTLLETIIAVVILSSALLLLVNSWGGAYMRIRKTQLNFEVSALLERKMTEVELEYRGKPLEAIPEEKEEDFGDEFPQYSWKLKSKKLELPDLSAALTAQDGGADQFTIALVKQLTDGLSQMIKEVTVTIVFSPPKGNKIEQSVTTYFVDYEKELSLGIPGG